MQRARITKVLKMSIKAMNESYSLEMIQQSFVKVFHVLKNTQILSLNNLWPNQYTPLKKKQKHSLTNYSNKSTALLALPHQLQKLLQTRFENLELNQYIKQHLHTICRCCRLHLRFSSVRKEYTLPGGWVIWIDLCLSSTSKGSLVTSSRCQLSNIIQMPVNLDLNIDSLI